MRTPYLLAIGAMALHAIFSCGSETLETRGSMAAGAQSSSDSCKGSKALKLADNPNYEVNLKPVLDVSCATAGCHSGNNPSKGIQLATYAGAKAAMAASINEIEANKMPISGKPKPSAAQVQMMKDWMATGFAEKPSAQPNPTATPKPTAAAGETTGNTVQTGEQSNGAPSTTGSSKSKASSECK